MDAGLLDFDRKQDAPRRSMKRLVGRFTLRRGSSGGMLIYQGRTLIGGFNTQLSSREILEGEGEKRAEKILQYLNENS